MNLRLLAMSGVTLAVLAVALYFLRGYRQEQLVSHLLTRADTLSADGDWRSANFYLQRYVQLRPTDFAARLRLVNAAQELAAESGQRDYLVRLLYETIGLTPADDTLELPRLYTILSEQLLQNGDLVGASEMSVGDDAQRVLESGEPEFQARALRVAALARLYQAPRKGVVSDAERRGALSEIMPLLEQALAVNQGDVTLAVATAELYREYPLLAEGQDAAAKDLADKKLDDLVASKPGDPDALVARYGYRKRHRLDGALDDLRAAYAANQQHYEACLLLGLESFAESTPESIQRAEDYFRSAIESRPTDERGYLMLAQLEWQAGKPEQALGTLEEAAKALPPQVIATAFMRAELLLSQGKTELASELVQSLRQQVDQQLVRLTTEAGAEYNNRLRLLEARMSAAQGDLASAVSYYKAISTSPNSGASSEVFRRASQGVAQVLAQNGRWDQVAGVLSGLADRLAEELAAPAPEGLSDASLTGPQALRGEYQRARIQAAEAFVQAGQPAEAIKQLDKLAEQQNAGATGRQPLPSEALDTRLLAELAIQLDLLPQDRHWEEFRALIQNARDANPDSQRVFFAQLYYLLATRADSDAGATGIRAAIDAAAEQFSDSAGFWKTASQAYIQLGDAQAAEAALKRYIELEPDAGARGNAWVGFLVGVGRNDEAQAWIQQQLSNPAEDNQTALRRLEAQLLVKSGKQDEALGKAIAIAEESRDADDLAWALEIAGALGDWEAAERIEGRLAAAKAANPGDLEYFTALRLVSNYSTLSQAEKGELTRLVAAVRSERPSWQRGAELAARLAEARGDDAEAVQNYELAVALGDRRPTTLQRLSLHLFRSGQYDRAQTVVNRLMSGKEEVSRGVESLAISTAIKRDRLDEALLLARSAVEEHPEDAARRLWLYQVLQADGQAAEAELVLIEARNEQPESDLLWTAHFSHLVQAKRPEEARALLDQLPASIATQPFAKNVALARCHELLGDLVKARGYYLDAVRLRPNEAAVRLRFANMLLSSDPAAARGQFEEVLKQQPENSEARRKMAALLAATGDSADWGRIDELLETAESSGDVLDRRLRAVLLTRRGRSIEERASNSELARRILLGIVEDSEHSTEDMDRLLLAGAYEQEAILKNEPEYFESARAQLRTLLNSASPGQDFRALYITYLIRSVDRLSAMEGSDPMRQAFARDARDRIEDLRRSLAAAEQGVLPLQQQAIMGLQVRLLNAEGKQDQAKAALKEFAEQHVASEADENVRARLILGLGTLYSLVGDHESAEPWYRELIKMAPGAKILLSQSLVQQGRPSAAIELFLNDGSETLSAENATAVAGLLAASESDPSAFEMAWPAIEGALDQHSKDVDLLLSVAVLQVTRGNQEEAIRLFRHVIELAPDHSLALNNLATLLGERENDRAEALDLVAHAIRVSGRSPALLDTQGTIQLQLGDATAAISSLEESVANVNVDPRYYFHLAAAYLAGGKREAALEALEEANRRGLEKTVLTTADKELMEELKAGLGGARTALKEAS